jgi:hypothetical protein
MAQESSSQERCGEGRANLRPINNREEWDNLVIGHDGHPLQLWGWGRVKELHGPWQAQRLWSDALQAGAQLLVRRLPWPFASLAYLSRGPFGRPEGASSIAPPSPRGAPAQRAGGLAPQEASNYNPEATHPSRLLPAAATTLLAELRAWARAQGCIELKIEPHWPADAALPRGFRPSKNKILISNTVILDLSLDGEELLAAATKKTRQYIRKSAKDGVSVREVAAPTAPPSPQALPAQRTGGLAPQEASNYNPDAAPTPSADIARCLAIYRQTAERAGFGIHVDNYYLDIARELGARSRLFVAEHQGTIVAFLWLIVTPALAFELYGGMDDAGQRLRANYTLKWQAIALLAAEGVALYDMNGLLNDGVSTFKLGFSGGREDILMSTLDARLSPLATVWEGLLPQARGLARCLGR